MKKSMYFLLIGVLLMLAISACGKQKYKLLFDGYGFESKKTEYASGEKVTVYYDFIATDTNYTFYIDDDVTMKQSYDNDHGYVFTFTMPDHDVEFTHTAENTMTALPGSYQPDNSFLGSASQEPPEGTWVCPECGNWNTGKFCSECGHKQPEE